MKEHHDLICTILEEHTEVTVNGKLFKEPSALRAALYSIFQYKPCTISVHFQGSILLQEINNEFDVPISIYIENRQGRLFLCGTAIEADHQEADFLLSVAALSLCFGLKAKSFILDVHYDIIVDKDLN
jgi:predicted transcriptional regulator